MAERVPLVLAGGQVERLQTGDTLAGVGSGVPTTMQTSLNVPAFTQISPTRRIVLGPGLRITLNEDSVLSVRT